MTNLFQINKAQIIGRGHILSGVNNQDALRVGYVKNGENETYYGVICDGCSEGKNSEVGAKLAVEYLGNQIETLVKSRTKLSKISLIIHKRLISFMKNILNRMQFDSQYSRINFIKNNFLFTVLGFILNRTQLMIFVQGDGVIVVNNDVQILNENDSPLYIGYELIERQYLTEQASILPAFFESQFWETNLVDRFAIASDSLGNEVTVIPEIWNNPKELSLQKRINAYSWNDHMFRDDLAIIVGQRNPQGGKDASILTEQSNNT